VLIHVLLHTQSKTALVRSSTHAANGTLTYQENLEEALQFLAGIFQLGRVRTEELRPMVRIRSLFGRPGNRSTSFEGSLCFRANVGREVAGARWCDWKEELI
jgi:hypothetical protein